jgi:hypothetical protein
MYKLSEFQNEFEVLEKKILSPKSQVQTPPNRLVLFEKLNTKTMSDQVHKTTFEQQITRRSGRVVKVKCQSGQPGDPRFGS